MYEDLMKDVQEKIQPAIDVAEINKKAMETLFALQSEYVTDFVDSSVAQLKALSEVKDPKEAVDLQVKFFKGLEEKLTAVAEKEMAALSEAKEEISVIVEKSLSEISEMPYVADFNKFLTEAAEATAAAVPAAEAAPKAAVKKAPAKKAPAKRKPAAKVEPKPEAAE